MPIAPERSGTGGEFTGSSFGTPSGPGAPSGPGGISGPGGGSVTVAHVPPPGAVLFGPEIYTVLRDATDREQYGPAVQILARDRVYVGPAAPNTVNAFYSTTRSAKSGPRIALAVGAQPQEVRVRNLNEIDAYSANAGEGIAIVVQRGQS